ncbi:GH12 family glycosyl hydrolase domain-containing protein [Neptunicella sp. SCSIO 80796]|uniref:GH12 family glycosyl hydrolase domain-containing protein n=1 Tax=Neptunicella plasticusilytica TaxID=3117012 RepID=UPI003A4D4227
MMLIRLSLMFFIPTLVLLSCSQKEATKSDWQKPATTTISCDDYALQHTPSGMLFNNVWNKDAAKSFDWRQCLEKSKSEEVYGWSWKWPSDSDTIYAYPQIKLGTSPWAPTPADKGDFPLNYANLKRLLISHKLEVSGNSEHNVATSMWLTNSANIGAEPNPATIVAELMIWSYTTPNHMDPAGRYQGDVNVDQQQWEVWADNNWGDVSGQHNNHWIYLTFRAKKRALASKFDVIPLVQYAVEHQLLPQTFYIADIELGTEIMSGSGLVWLKSFDISIDKKQ